MKLLLDEQMPRKIATYFPSECNLSTVQSEGWSGIENGEPLKLVAARGFGALISADKNISYQQNQAILVISVVVLEVLRLRIKQLAPLIPRAIEELKLSTSPTLIRITT